MKFKTKLHPLTAATRSADCQSAASRIGNPPDRQGVRALPNSTRRRGRLTICAALAFAALRPSPLLACAACYGRSDSALAQGMNWGIFTLMGVILTVLTCILVFFVHIIRKEEKMTNDSAPANPPRI